MTTTGERFERAVAIMEKLRSPEGCPWDREQNFDSIKPYTLEETYEVLEAIDNRDWNELPGELGDLLLQVLFYSQMAREQKTFSIDDVLDRLASKLINRHPHVFGDVKAETSGEVLRNWQAIKEQEKQEKLKTSTPSATALRSKSILQGISSAMPALMEAGKLSSRAAQTGFDWPDLESLFAKLAEETNELHAELKQLPQGAVKPSPTSAPEALRRRIESEVGDLFFVLVNIARYLSIDPESALRKTNRKFRSRFQWMEQQLAASGRTPEQTSMDELEALWQKAKQQESVDL